MNVMPWEPYKKETSYVTSSWRHTGPIKCIRVLEHVSDSTLQYWRKGDIIKFENGLCWWECGETWEEWFLSEKDYMKFLKTTNKRRPTIPMYAALQYAIIIGKYRIIKKKWFRTFYDYGTVVLMLSGTRKGHHRKYHRFSPFEKVSSYPHSKIPEKIANFSDIILRHKEDSEECRNNLVSMLYKRMKEC